MKNLIMIFLAVGLSACGSSPSSGSGNGATTPGNQNPVGNPTYTMVISGDGVQFAANIYGDTQENPGIQTVPNGGTITIQTTGTIGTVTAGITRVSAPGNTLVATLYRNGVQLGMPTALYNPGDTHDFGSN